MSDSIETPFEWRADWTADDPVQFVADSRTLAEATWKPGPLDFLEKRDVGVAEASAHSVSLDHLRATGMPYQMDGDWEIHDCDLFLLFVLQGSVTFESADGQTEQLFERGSALIPRGLRFRRFEFTPDFEGLEMRCPDECGDDPREITSQKATYRHDRRDEYIQGAGPRSFFHYRDLGLSEVTDGRMKLHIVENHGTTSMDGTRWHYHSMCQWYYVLEGFGVSSVEGDKFKRRLVRHEAGTIGRGTDMRHDWWMHAGYVVLELCIPAEYETITVEEPPPGGHADFTFLKEPPSKDS